MAGSKMRLRIALQIRSFWALATGQPRVKQTWQAAGKSPIFQGAMKWETHRTVAGGFSNIFHSSPRGWSTRRYKYILYKNISYNILWIFHRISNIPEFLFQNCCCSSNFWEVHHLRPAPHSGWSPVDKWGLGHGDDHRIIQIHST